MTKTMAMAVAVLLLLAGCGDDGGGASPFGPGDAASSDNGDGDGGGGGGSLTADIEPCTLFTDAELTAVLGTAYVGDESAPAGPFTGCSWGTGEVLISLATTDTPILAPGQEDECPSANLGDRSFICPGKVTVLVGGIQYSVTTISPLVEEEQLVSLAEIVLPKLSS